MSKAATAPGTAEGRRSGAPGTPSASPEPRPAVPYELATGPEQHLTLATFFLPRRAAPLLAQRPVAIRGSYFELKAEEPPAPEPPEGGAEGGGGDGAPAEGEVEPGIARDAVFTVFYSPKPQSTALAIAEILAQRLLEFADLLFTPRSPLADESVERAQVAFEVPPKVTSSMLVWIGESPKDEQKPLKDAGLPATCKVVALSWSEHPAAETLRGFDLRSDEVVDGSWYLKERRHCANADFDLLQDADAIGRAIVEVISAKVTESQLEWRSVVLAGFGKGAGLLLYALKMLPQPVGGAVLVSPVVVLPAFYRGARQREGAAPPTKLFSLWGEKNVSTPESYRSLLTSKLNHAKGLQHSCEKNPEGTHALDKPTVISLGQAVAACLDA